MPIPCSTCAHAPTWRSTVLIQPRFQPSNARAALALAMFWPICRTTLALLR